MALLDFFAEDVEADERIGEGLRFLGSAGVVGPQFFHARVDCSLCGSNQAGKT